jgi:hypothetical protein
MIRDKEVVGYIPVFTLLAIIMGTINVYSYYANFRIDILPYLSPTEILFSFASIMFELIIVVGMLLIIYWLDYYFELNSVKGPGTMRWKKPAGYWVVLYLVSIAACIGGSVLYFYQSRGTLLLLYMSVVSLPVVLTDMYLLAPNKSVKKRTAILFLLIVALSTAYIYIHNRAKFLRFNEDKPTIQYVITLNNGVELQTDERRRFVGHTNNYFFFKDMKDSKIEIIPTSLIEKIEVLEIPKEAEK